MGQFGQREFDKFFLFFNNLLDDDLVHGNPPEKFHFRSNWYSSTSHFGR